jgi:hypothetical protein
MVTTDRAVRAANMALDFQDELERVVEMHQDKDHFFILYTMGSENSMLKETWMIMNPPEAMELMQIPMLGTILMEVNNKIGDARMVWCLPLDKPEQESYAGKSEFVHECSKHVPIRWK